MARTPYDPVPESSASGPSGGFESVQSSPADFGGLVGQATQKLGGDIGQAAQAAANNAIEMQGRQNQIVSTDAFNQMQKAELGVTAGDPSTGSKGYFALQGKDALTGYDAASSQLDAAHERIKASLSNDAQRVEFENASRRLITNSLNSMRQHFIQQQNVYGAEVSKAAISNGVQAIGVQPDNEDTFNNNLEQIRMNAYRTAVNNGYENDPDVLHQHVQEGEQAAILARVQAMQARDPVNGPAKALDWLHNGKIPDTQVPGQPLTYSPVSNHLLPGTLETLNTHFKAVSEEAQIAGGINSVIGGPTAPPAAAQARGAATNAAWERMVGASGTDHGIEAGEDNQGNARVSPAGATGAAQTLLSTAQETAAKHGVPYNPDAIKPGPGYDSSYSKMLGRLYFGDMMEKYSGNVTLATAAYNAGPGRVDEWVKTIGDPRKGVVSDATFASQIPITETKNYVLKTAQPSTSPNIAPPAAVHAGADGADAIPYLKPGQRPLGYITPATDDGQGDQPITGTLASSDQTATAQPAVVRPGAAPTQGAAGTGQSGAVPPPGAHAASAGAYGAESAMVENAWKTAQSLFPNRPDLQQKMVRGVYEHISQQNVLQQKYEAEQAKADKEAQNGIMNGVITTLNQDPTKFDPKVLDAKKPDGSYVLAPDQRENLMRYSKQRLTESGIEDTAPYGKGYAQAYRDIFADPNSPSKINDINDILRRGGPDGDLSGVGVQKLAQVFQLSRKNPDEQALNQTSASLMTYAKNHLSFQEDTGPIKIRDPKGEAIFNAQFVPRFEAGLAAAKAGGDPKKVWDYLQQDNIDKMISTLRNPTQMAKDRLAATGQVDPGDVEPPGTPIPPPPTDLREPAGADGKPGAPVQINPREWSNIMTVVPKAQNGQPFTHQAWSQALHVLLSDPEKMGPKFDQFFGPAGFSSESILKRLTSKEAAAQPTQAEMYRISGGGL